MKTHMKQIRANLFFSGKILISLFAVVLFIGLSSSVSFAPTQISPKPSKMSDSDLADIDAQAFFKIEHFASSNQFWSTPTVVESSINGSLGQDTYPVYTFYNTGSQNVIRISLDMEVQVHGFVEAQRQGYRYGWQGAGSGDEWGWDIDLTNMWIGDRSPTGAGAPLVLNGIILDVGFDNIGNNATRKLNYIEVGSLGVTGNVTQTIEKVNGMFAQGGTGSNNGVLLRQTASGTRVLNFNNEVFTLVFANKYAYKTYDGSQPVDVSGTDDIAPGHVRGTFIKIPNYHSTDDLQRP